MTREEELKKIIIDAKEELKKIKEPMGFLDAVSERPIDTIRVCEAESCRRHSGIYIEHGESRNWRDMIDIAKHIYFDEIMPGRGDKIISVPHKQLKICDLSAEQRKLSTNFLNEIIPIYNKYVKLANPLVEFKGELVSPWGDGYEAD